MPARPVPGRIQRKIDDLRSCGPWDRVLLCRELQDYFRQQEVRAVRQLRKDGWSWAAIGDLLGFSRQAAQQLYGPTLEATDR